MKRLLVAVAIVSTLGVTPKADSIQHIPFWPGDGIWLHFVSDWQPNLNHLLIYVYCGYGCVEHTYWNTTEPPNNPGDVWVHDPVSHNQWWEYPYVYAQADCTGPA